MKEEVVTIRLEGRDREYCCRGKTSGGVCDGCRLRFKCLTDRIEITIPKKLVSARKLTDINYMAKYMFGEGKIKYRIINDGQRRFVKES